MKRKRERERERMSETKLKLKAVERSSGLTDRFVWNEKV
jgi:hypothetical protein